MRIFNLNITRVKPKIHSNSILAFLKQEKNLANIKQIEEQIRSNELIVNYRYKDDEISIINEEAAIYHIVKTTPKIEKLVASTGVENSGVTFDIGANIGLFSYYYKKRHPLSKIFLFEPDERLVPIIHQNMKSFNGYTLIQKAISDVDGQVTFYRNKKSSQTNSTELDAVTPFAKREDVISNTVSAITLNTFCRENSIDKIETFKIDIQGGEYRALKNSESVLNNIKEVLIEISFITDDAFHLIELINKHFKSYTTVNEVFMGADLRLYNS
jgi:FkbM family methyltransferase